MPSTHCCRLNSPILRPMHIQSTLCVAMHTLHLLLLKRRASSLLKISPTNINFRFEFNPNGMPRQTACSAVSACNEGRTTDVTVVPVQQRKCGLDCGVFSIANAYNTALGRDLSTIEYEQERMRSHVLYTVLSEGV